MANKNNEPDPNTTVPHDETNDAEASGRAATRKANVPPAPIEPTTTVPHDDT